ncbi:AMP-binding protein [Streptomyces phaeofaciens JCM 4814]|uniref:Fatty-acid-CoA ligase FadD n=1 Tax=Streptomyces phaeofaciens TaxID=68254 RepID=A0A918H3M5_9ACTN|nr:class I adenylate-forming enzyme family protein [Streptomyces phaeofaciens]GGT36221.1 putative fatty-acid-CoA ligase FadD [Streptomyces phaeofaciens]
MLLHLPASRRPLRLGLIPEEAAARHPHVPFTLDHDMDAAPEAGRTLTVAALADLVDDMAARLWAAGVRAGEHLALYKAHNFDIWVLACAASRLGAVPVLLSPALDGPTVGALLDRLDRPHLLTDGGKLADELAGLDLAKAAATVVVPAGELPGTVSLESLAGSPRRQPVLLDGDHPALMTHTSGTTGIPKLVVHTALSLRGRYRPQEYLVSLLRRKETYAIHVSFVHSRMYMALAVMLEHGMPVVVIDHGAPEEVAPLLARTRPGIVETHPNSYVEWADLADHPLRPLANVRVFSGTFDAIHPPTIHKLLSASRRSRPLFFQFYGQSECGPLVARWYTRKNAYRANGRCLGYPLPGMTHVRVVPRDGQRPSKKTPGFIEVLSDGRAVDYYAEGERYRKELNGRWWRTGDVGYRDRWGRVHVLDRAVDVIPNVDSTLEVEDAVLGRLEELLELVLVPGPAQEPLPVVCTKGDVPLDPVRWRRAVVDFPQLADPVQMPLSELPRTATMKVQRIELARRLRERLEQAG